MQDELNKICIKQNFLGKGGNGTVYRIPNTDNVIKKVKFYFNKKSGKLNKKEEKKYLRFKDEIKIVKQSQNEIKGILPIIDYCNLPQLLSSKDLIYYTMPYATQLKTIKFKSTKDIVKCFFDLFTTLQQLHNKGIAHRDIKPENLYKYQNRYVFSDFGLVKYTSKTNLTKGEKKIGAWNTIAPEMERNPFDADVFKADIYSLAKTFWIILTGCYNSFEGQYHHNDQTISLYNLLESKDENRYLAIFNDILNRCTSNDPKSRPELNEILKLLKAWIDEDFGILCAIEWKLILNDISPYNASTLIWDKEDDIFRILKIISRSKSLNHTFFPDGGGLDLLDVQYYKDSKIIELDFGNRAVFKPKKLYINTFEDPQWNHCYIEFENFPSQFIDSEYYNQNDTRKDYLKISENKYIEYWAKNYDEYNNYMILPEYKEIQVYHKGNIVIFPKDSHYNLRLNYIHFRTKSNDYTIDTYNGVHHKIGSANNFKFFIDELLKYLAGETNLEKSFTEIIRLYAFDHQKKNDNSKNMIYENIKDKIQEIDLSEIIDLNKICEGISSSCHYHIKITSSIEEFDINSNLSLILKDRFIEWGTHYKKSTDSELLNINNLDDAKEIKKNLENYLNLNMPQYMEDINVNINYKRIKPIPKVFNKTLLETALSNGNDTDRFDLLINHEGELVLNKYNNNYNYYGEFSALLHTFFPHENLLGNRFGQRTKDFIETNYTLFLEILLTHLKTKTYVTKSSIYDYYTDQQLEDEIIKINKTLYMNKI